LWCTALISSPLFLQTGRLLHRAYISVIRWWIRWCTAFSVYRSIFFVVFLCAAFFSGIQNGRSVMFYVYVVCMSIIWMCMYVYLILYLSLWCVYVDIYVCMYVCMHACMYACNTYKYTYIHICIHTYIYTCMHAVHACICVYV
jgi:hypothetical protein